MIESTTLDSHHATRSLARSRPLPTSGTCRPRKEAFWEYQQHHKRQSNVGGDRCRLCTSPHQPPDTSQARNKNNTLAVSCKTQFKPKRKRAYESVIPPPHPLAFPHWRGGVVRLCQNCASLCSQPSHCAQGAKCTNMTSSDPVVVGSQTTWAHARSRAFRHKYINTAVSPRISND
jgi:hypothetical protein